MANTGGSGEGLRGTLYDPKGNLFANVSTLKESIVSLGGGYVDNFNEPTTVIGKNYIRDLTSETYPTTSATGGKTFHTFGTYGEFITPTLNLGNSGESDRVIEFRDIKRCC